MEGISIKEIRLEGNPIDFSGKKPNTLSIANYNTELSKYNIPELIKLHIIELIEAYKEQNLSKQLENTSSNTTKQNNTVSKPIIGGYKKYIKHKKHTKSHKLFKLDKTRKLK